MDIQKEFSKRIATKKQSVVIQEIAQLTGSKKSKIRNSLLLHTNYKARGESVTFIRENRGDIISLINNNDCLKSVREKILEDFGRDISESYLSLLAMGPKGLIEYSHMIIEEVSKNPQNLIVAFSQAQTRINKDSIRQYSAGAIRNLWYTKLNKSAEVFKMVSRHVEVTNMKNVTAATKQTEIKNVKTITTATYRVVFKTN